MTVLGLDHVQIAMPPGREGEARAFYGHLLGLSEIEKPRQLASRGGVWFACGDLQIHLGVEHDFRPASKAHPAFKVSHLEDLLSELRRAGYEASHDLSLPDIRRAFTSDPFGNRIELIDA